MPAGRALDHCRVANEIYCQSLSKIAHALSYMDSESRTDMGERTGIQEIECLVEDIGFLDLRVTAIDNESVTDQKTCVSYPWARALRCGGQRIA